jgi:hypothetical protein
MTEQHLPLFLKRNATAEDSVGRDLEWHLLEVMALKNDGILGLRLTEVAGGQDVVHLLITPDCRRGDLAVSLQLAAIKKAVRNKVREEPGHFIPIPASALERTAWWAEEIAPKIRADYFKRRRELSDGPMTRAVTPEELSEIAAIKGNAPHSNLTRTDDRPIAGQSLGNRERKAAVMDWLRERHFDEITEAMVGIGKVGRNADKLVEINLPTKNPGAPLVRRLKHELEKTGVPAEPIHLTNALVFRFPVAVFHHVDA